MGTLCPQLGHVDSSCTAVLVVDVSTDDACDVVLADVLVLDTLSELFLDFFRLEDGMLDEIVDFLLSWCINIADDLQLLLFRLLLIGRFTLYFMGLVPLLSSTSYFLLFQSHLSAVNMYGGLVKTIEF